MNSLTSAQLAMIPVELQDKVIKIATEYDSQLLATEYTANSDGNMVSVSVKYPGSVSRVEFNCELKEENKTLLQDLLVTTTERAFKKLDQAYKETTIKLAEDIRILVHEYIKNKEPGLLETKEDEDDFFN